MNLKIEKNFTVNKEKEKVWSVLSDPYAVVNCLPGAEIAEKLSENEYEGLMKVKIGPFEMKFKGIANFTEVNHEDHRLVLSGKGADQGGKGNVSADVKLFLTGGDGSVTVEVESDLSMGGKVAQFGSRLIEAVSNTVFDKFVKNFEKLIELDDHSEFTKEELKAGSLFKDTVKGIFSKK